MKKIFVLLSLLLLVSCAKDTQPKKVRVSFGSLKNLPATLTDILIVGVNPLTGDFFSFAFDQILDNGISLQAGPWAFLVVGWDGITLASDTFNGNMRCGGTDSIEITADTNIDLVVTQLDCSNNNFAPSAAARTNNQPDPLYIHHCIGWDGTSDPSTCSTSSQAASYRISINGIYTNPTINPENSLGFLDRCFSNTKGSTLAGFYTGVKLPLFSFEAPVPMTITTHSDANCTICTNYISGIMTTF